MYEQIINSDSTALTTPVNRILDGVRNLVVSKESQVKKAPRLNLDIVKKMVEKVIIPYVSNPERVNAKDLRTVFRVTVIYFTFCRFNCFSSLKAENFHDNGTESRMIQSTKVILQKWFKMVPSFVQCSIQDST